MPRFRTGKALHDDCNEAWNKYCYRFGSELRLRRREA
jgi:hypothetical protein